MTTAQTAVAKHVGTARERAAGGKAARAWIQDLAAQHLLDTQAPIKDTPYPGPSEVTT
jgi:hypothetical protein